MVQGKSGRTQGVCCIGSEFDMKTQKRLLKEIRSVGWSIRPGFVLNTCNGKYTAGDIAIRYVTGKNRVRTMHLRCKKTSTTPNQPKCHSPSQNNHISN